MVDFIFIFHYVMGENKTSKYINFYDLKIWQKARDITKIIYPLTDNAQFQKDW